METLKSKKNGFTLIELMIVLSILALVAAVAIPSFSSFIAKNRVSTKTDEVVSLLSHAKSMSVTQRATYAVYFSDSGVASVAKKGGETIRENIISENGVFIKSPPDSVEYMANGFLNAAISIFVCSGSIGNRIDVSKSGVVKKNIYDDC